MTTFEDGPAKGQTLSLARAPLFLRVVHDNAATSQHGWDALDQAEDSPRERESIHVYLLAHRPGHVHINRGRKGSGWYAIASYRLYAQQPDDATMRDSGRWSVWVHDQNPQALAGALPDYGSAEQVRRAVDLREIENLKKGLGPPAHPDEHRVEITREDVRLAAGEPKPTRRRPPDDPNQGKLL